MNLTDFDALTFDCYGTLIDWEGGILEALRPWLCRNQLRVTEGELLSAYGELESREEAVAPTQPYPAILAAVFAGIARRFGAAVTQEELHSFSQSVRDWPAFVDSPAALQYLQQHYRLAIISNVDRASFAHSQAKLGIEFAAIITAEDVGSYKPDRRNFEFAFECLKQIGAPRERVLHVAQSLYHDHVPAKSLGMRTVWVDRRAGKPGQGATRPPAVEVYPDLTVNDLASLVDIHRAAQLAWARQRAAGWRRRGGVYL